jgi:hypothetical protein
MKALLPKGRLAGLLILLTLSSGSVAGAEIVQEKGIRVSFQGDLTPKRLPRSAAAPVEVSVGAKLASAKGKTPPQLQRMSIAINRYGRLDSAGLPVCQYDQIQPATTGDALAACRRSMVGEGSFKAKVLLKGQAPFPSNGDVYAFSGEYEGHPAILAHVYGTEPAPTSFTLPFVISRAKGTFGTTLTASLPKVTAGVGYVTGLSLKLGKSFSYRGSKRAYLSASCPAPKGLSAAPFPFAKASFGFAGGKVIRSTLIRTCKVRG